MSVAQRKYFLAQLMVLVVLQCTHGRVMDWRSQVSRPRVSACHCLQQLAACEQDALAYTRLSGDSGRQRLPYLLSRQAAPAVEVLKDLSTPPYQP